MALDDVLVRVPDSDETMGTAWQQVVPSTTRASMSFRNRFARRRLTLAMAARAARQSFQDRTGILDCPKVDDVVKAGVSAAARGGKDVSKSSRV